MTAYRSAPRDDEEEDPTLPSQRWGDESPLPLPLVPLWSALLALLLLGSDGDGG